MNQRRVLGKGGIKKRVLMAIAAAVFLSLAYFIGWRLPGLTPALPQQCLSERHLMNQARCFEPYLQASVKAARIQEAIGTLASLIHEGKLDDCHMLAHHLGHLAYPAHGDVARAIRAGDKRCGNGYYHGVVEAALHPSNAAGHSHSPADPASLCVGLKGDEAAYDGCVHGLGHGFMHASGHDVYESLKNCGRLPAAYEQHRCEGGVFMENAMRYLDLDDESYLREAPRACDGLVLAGNRSHLCANQVGEIAMFYFRHRLDRALALCEAMANPTARAACRQGAEEEGASIAQERAKGGEKGASKNTAPSVK